jgi:Leucine-rich repeat (LRR) protein
LCKLTSLTYYEDHEGYKRAQETTDASVAKLRDFPDLERLALPSQQLGDDSLGTIIGLKKLEKLDLIGSYGTAAWTPRLAALLNMRSLGINSLDQEGADALKNLRGLQRLHIAGSKAKSLDLSGFSSIQSLTLATDDDPVAWGKPLQWPPNLQSLCMSAWAMDDGGTGKSVLRHALPATVRCVRLRLFQGSPGICVTPREFAERKPSDLTWLQTLPNLAELELVDPLPEDFNSILALAHLRRLALTPGRWSLTEKQIEKVNKLQQLESLTLWIGCRTGAALGAIAEIKGLRELTISATRPGVTKLWALSRLEKLTLRLSEAVGGAPVDDPLLGIGDLSELKEITLRGTVTDAELKNLAGLKNLKQLDLSNCQGFSDVGLAELVKSLPGLKTVVWAWHREQKP